MNVWKIYEGWSFALLTWPSDIEVLSWCIRVWFSFLLYTYHMFSILPPLGKWLEFSCIHGDCSCIDGECCFILLLYMCHVFSSPCIRQGSIRSPCIRYDSVRSLCIRQGSTVYGTRSVLDTRERVFKSSLFSRPSRRFCGCLRVFVPLTYSPPLLSASGPVVYGGESVL